MDTKTIDTLIMAVVVVAIIVVLMYTFHAMRKTSALEGYRARARVETMTPNRNVPIVSIMPASEAIPTPLDYNRFRLEGTFHDTGLPARPDDLQNILY